MIDKESGGVRRMTDRGVAPGFTNFLPAITGLRGILAVVVLAFHCGLVPWSHHRVTWFLILSGFLATWMLVREYDKTGALDVGRFLKRRAVRLLPAFYFLLVFSITIRLLVGREVAWDGVVAALLMLNNYYSAFHEGSRAVSIHTWTIGLEAQFYLVWPFLLMLLLPRRRFGIGYLAGLVGCFWAWRAWVHVSGPVSPHYLTWATDMRADSLIMGGMGAMLLWKRRDSDWMRDLLSLRATALVVGLLLVSMAYFRGDLGYGYAQIIDGVLLTILSMQIIWMGRSRWLAWLDSRPLLFLGRLSYGIFLFQSVPLNFFNVVLQPENSTPLMRTLFVLPVTILLAWASDVWLESRFRPASRSVPRTALEEKAEAIRAAA